MNPIEQRALEFNEKITWGESFIWMMYDWLYFTVKAFIVIGIGFLVMSLTAQELAKALPDMCASI